MRSRRRAGPAAAAARESLGAAVQLGGRRCRGRRAARRSSTRCRARRSSSRVVAALGAVIAWRYLPAGGAVAVTASNAPGDGEAALAPAKPGRPAPVHPSDDSPSGVACRTDEGCACCRRPSPSSALALLLPALAVPAAASLHRPATATAAQVQDQQAPEDEADDPGEDPDGAYDDAGQQAQDDSSRPCHAGPGPAAGHAAEPEPLPARAGGAADAAARDHRDGPGRDARLRTDGKAAIPRGAPLRVRAIIAAANRIVGKRYKWGGGHASSPTRAMTAPAR